MASSNSNVGSSSTPSTTSQNIQVIQHNRKAAVWENFNLVVVDGKEKAQCKKCHGLLTAQGNSTLRRHVEKSCTKRLVDAEDDQMQIGPDGHNWQFDMQLCRDWATKLVLQVGLPFNVLDNEKVTAWIQNTLQPKYQQVTRMTLKRDAIKMWGLAQQEMQKYFKAFPGRVALTTDVWSANHNLPDTYMCVTCHWIDPMTWNMCKRTIAFDVFGHPHSGKQLYGMLMHTMSFYKIKNKIMSISFDNASNNNVCARQLKTHLNTVLDGQFLHTRCCCHIINLVVKNGLSFIEGPLHKFREMINYIFKMSKKRQQEYIRLCRSMNYEALKGEIDMPIRWNSTYKMINRLVRQKTPLMAFYNERQPRHDIKSTDWELIESFVQILEVFYNATNVLSGVYYPTSNLLLPQLFIMAKKLEEFEHHYFWHETVTEMKTKLLKYYKELPPVFTCAAALNPTINVEGVEGLIEDISRALGITNDEVGYINLNKRYFNEIFRDLFVLYNEKFRGSSSITEPTPHAGGSSSSSSYTEDMLYEQLYNNSRKKSKSASNLDELGLYAQSNFLMYMNQEQFKHFNILQWWNEKQSQFPVLAAMARDLLTVQASTVASESCFSSSGRILSERRTRLSAQSLELCVCLKDYYDSNERIQHKESLENGLVDIEEDILEDERSKLPSPNTDEDLSDIPEEDEYYEEQ